MTRTLVVIGLHWPEPESTAAGLRMLQLLKLFQSYGYAITYLSSGAETPHSFALSSIGVSCQRIAVNDAQFDTLISTLKPQVVLFDRFVAEEQFGWRVRAAVPEALTVLDTEDLHCLRKVRQQLKGDFSLLIDQLKASDTAKREIASIYRCDLSLIISEFEMDVLKTHFQIPETLLYYLPFLVEASDIQTQALPAYDARQHFMTVGNFKHAPNYDAVLYLKESLWPSIRAQNPKAELHIYGAYTPEKVKQLHHAKSGFIIKGYAEDIDRTMQQYKVCLAALRFGAGLKGKLLKAMQNGLPCVMTALGAEGMFGDIAPNGFVADSSDDFITKATQLYTSEALWTTSQAQGFDVLQQRFDLSVFSPLFQDRLQALLGDLQAHRLTNFVGLILQHHQHQSTMYMSKWIAAKNKTS